MAVVRQLIDGYSQAAPTDRLLVQRRAGYHPTGGMPVVLYCHSAGGSAVEPATFISPAAPANSTVDRLVRAIAEAGYLVVAGDFGLRSNPGDVLFPARLFGNDEALARMADALTWARSKGGGRGGPAQVMGFSMGGGAAQAFAVNYPADVASLSLFAPVCSLQDFAANNRAGQAPAVNAAYGGTYVDATHGPLHSPVRFAAQPSVPADLWFSQIDTTCLPQFCQQVATAYGDRVTVHDIPGEHGTNAQVAAINPADVVAFLDAHRPAA